MSIASSSAICTGLLCDTIGPSTAIFIFCEYAERCAAETIGAGVKRCGE
jgi:hypothetical protein